MIYGRSISHRMADCLYLILPLMLVISWVTFLIMYPPIKKKQVITEHQSRIIEIEAEKFNGTSTYRIKRKINLSETVAYVDMWRSHWCTYYNDREFFFTPRINEMLQRLRQFDVPVVTISSVVDQYLPGSKQRIKGLKAIEKGRLPVLEEYNARQMAYHDEYIPGFDDICMYDGLDRYGPTRDNRFTPKIALSEKDYFSSNFKESAECFVGLGAKTVIVFGQHTNMCLMAVFLYCQQVGLDLIIVRDLTDGCWVYPLQKDHVNTHTKGNVATNNYFNQKFGCSIISFDLFRSLRQISPSIEKPKYQYFLKTTHMFRNFL